MLTSKWGGTLSRTDCVKSGFQTSNSVLTSREGPHIVGGFLPLSEYPLYQIYILADGDLTTSENGESRSMLETSEAKFDRDLDEERKLKLLQNTSALTPTNSILESCQEESGPDLKVIWPTSEDAEASSSNLQSLKWIELVGKM